jgi:hypothetical protein
VRLEGLGQLKRPMTSKGMEPTKDNIKIDRKEGEDVERIHLAQDRYQLRAIVNW